MIERIGLTDLTDEDKALLKACQDPRKIMRMFWDSVWGQCEAEQMIRETLSACGINLDKHGDPFSWLGTGTRTMAGGGLVNNPKGMNLITKSGYLVIEDAPEGLVPPKDTIHEKGKPQVLRITRKLLDYAHQEHSKLRAA
jgi:hypothetical protein